MLQLPHVALSERGSDVVVVSPVGDFDIDGTDKLRRAFGDAVSPTRCKVVVDLSESTFMDSMALGTLIGAAKRAQGWGGWLRLVAPTAYVQKVLRVTNLDTVFGVYDTVDDAIENGVD